MRGISFNGIHSYRDLNLVMSSADIPPASPKTVFVDVPGGDGTVDLSEALGGIRFSNREASFVFTVLPTDDFEQKKTQISNLLNGKRVEIILDKDSGYHWTGRCAVNEYASDRRIHKITVGATLSPYKLKNEPTTVTLTATGTAQSRTLTNARMPVVPEITCTAAVTAVFGGNTYQMNAGTHKIPGIRLTEGENVIQVSGSGTVTIKYREGDL